MRDLGDLAVDFPVVAGSIGPSHGFVHVREIDTPISVFGISVTPGDLVHADRHGAVVIPNEVIDNLYAAIQKLFASERLILDPADKKGFSFNDFKSAWDDFERSRT
jgi:regulator of RNase E activity RraA